MTSQPGGTPDLPAAPDDPQKLVGDAVAPGSDAIAPESDAVAPESDAFAPESEATAAMDPAIDPAIDPAGVAVATPPSRPDRGRRALPIVIAAALVVGVATAILGGPNSTPAGPQVIGLGRSASPSSQGQGYLTSVAELRNRASLAAAGLDPYQPAMNDLLAWAEKAIKIEPQPVQPLLVVGTDNVLVDDASRTYGLGIAYAVSHDERYAAAARDTIMAWVNTAQWTADTCVDSGGCHTSLIIGRAAGGFAMGADLIAGSTAWAAPYEAQFKAWLAKVILPAASERLNNWGDAGDFMRAVVADYVGDQPAFDRTIALWRSALDLIEADGRIPEESRRGTAGISYTQEALQYKVAVARIAEARGIDLWDARGAKGGSIRAALDRLSYYMQFPAEWPDDKNADVPSPGPVWELAYAHWKDPDWEQRLVESRPWGDRGHSAIRWTTLTNGIPLESHVAVGSPGPSASVSLSPSSIPASSSPSTPAVDPVSVPAPAVFTAALVETTQSGPVRVRLRWSAPSPVDRFEVQWSEPGGAWHSLAKVAGSRHSVDDARTAGSIHAYRIRSVAGAASSPWVALKAVTGSRVEPSSKTLDLHGHWTTAGSSAYSAGQSLSTSQVGATATWNGNAAGLVIIGPVGPTRGRMTVNVDGRAVATVSLHATTFRARQVLMAFAWGENQHHVVTIGAAGSVSGSTVALDEIVVLGADPTTGPGA